MNAKVLALALLILATPALGALTEGDHAVSLGLGLGVSSDDGDLDVHERYEGRYAHFFTPRFAFEGMVTHSRIEGLLSSPDGSMTEGFGGILWTFRQDKATLPYVVAGAGFQSVSSSLLTIDDGPVLQAGIGSFFFFTRKSPVGLRLEYSSTWGDVTTGSLVMGLTFRIRPKRAGAAPPALSP